MNCNDAVELVNGVAVFSFMAFLERIAYKTVCTAWSCFSFHNVFLYTFSKSWKGVTKVLVRIIWDVRVILSGLFFLSLLSHFDTVDLYFFFLKQQLFFFLNITFYEVKNKYHL